MYYLEKRKQSKGSNAEKDVRISGLGAKLQSSLYNNVSAVKMGKLIVVSLQRFVLDRKVTLQTLWTYEHHLLPLFVERHPGLVLSASSP